MADRHKRVDSQKPDLAASAGHQLYFLEVPGAANAQALSVVSFEAVERMGEPYRITLALTHPEALLKDDYLGKDAASTIAPADGTAPRKFCGCITRLSKTKTTRDFSAYQYVRVGGRGCGRFAIRDQVGGGQFVAYRRNGDRSNWFAGVDFRRPRSEQSKQWRYDLLHLHATRWHEPDGATAGDQWVKSGD